MTVAEQLHQLLIGLAPKSPTSVELATLLGWTTRKVSGALFVLNQRGLAVCDRRTHWRAVGINYRTSAPSSVYFGIHARRRPAVSSQRLQLCGRASLQAMQEIARRRLKEPECQT